MVTLATLVEQGTLVHHPAEWGSRPPRIAARSDAERSALGYLHGNCSGCHHGARSVGALGMDLRQPAAPGAPEPVARTAVGVPSGFRLPGDATGSTRRVEAGDPGRSAVLFRMATRNPMRQMPPLGTKVADDEGVEKVRAWIAGLGSPQPPHHEEERP
jgi:hypothetical protein